MKLAVKNLRKDEERNVKQHVHPAKIMKVLTKDAVESEQQDRQQIIHFFGVIEKVVEVQHSHRFSVLEQQNVKRQGRSSLPYNKRPCAYASGFFMLRFGFRDQGRKVTFLM